MAKKRPDGRVVKNIGALEKIVPYIMKTRTDSMMMYNDDYDCQYLDAYIDAKKADGIKFTYMDIIIASMIRTMAMRPRLNRFVMNGRIYTRPKVWVSYALQRSLRREEAETTIKLEFEGTETIFEIKEKIDKSFAETVGQADENGTDKTAGMIMKMPHWGIKAFIGLAKFLDKRNIMPKAIIKVSPFHTSFFITNLKSLGINYAYHHIYEFGTTGIFLGLGKERRRIVPDFSGNPIEKKILTLGCVGDERICDGLYYARSMHYFRKYMKDPTILETPLDHKVEDDL